MKKMIVNTLCLVVALSLTLVPPETFAFQESHQKGYGGGERDHHANISRLAEELGLTAEQKEQLREQRYQARLKRLEMRNQLQIKELELRHELEAKTINRQKVDTIVKELKEKHGQMLEERVEAVVALRSILTPEQYEKFQQVGIEKIRERMKERRGGFGRKSRKNAMHTGTK